MNDSQKLINYIIFDRDRISTCSHTKSEGSFEVELETI